MQAAVTVSNTVPIASSIYWGSRIDGAFYNTNYGAPTTDDAPWSAAIAGDGWDLFEAHALKKMTCVHWGGSGTALNNSFDSTADTWARSRGAFSMYTVGASTQQITDLANNSDANGTLTTVDSWATSVHSTNRPVLARPFWEMNGNWGYPWQTNQGITSAQYVSAFQTYHDRVAAIAPNVSFCWCPNVATGAIPDPTPWFPGTAYVDWMGMDGYGHAGATTESPSQLFNSTYAILQSLAPSKPVAICETGVSDTITSPTKTAWIADLFGTWLPGHLPVKLVCWFNETGNPTDPFIEISPYTSSSASAFAAAIASSYYKTNIVSATTFPSGAKVPIP